ncbi:MAG: ABC transporter ATP-binding protein [Alphaproteobacteria bacterium]|jgi:branched-chain amino acid transport system ATP-binding protein
MMPGTTPTLEVRNVTVRHGGVTAVRNASLTAHAGEITALLGVNGAGKTSLLRGIVGLAATDGEIRLDGSKIGALATEDRINAGIAWVPEGRRVFPGLTVAENLEVASQADITSRRERLAGVVALFPQLAGRLGDRAWQLSGGQQQMLAIGRALMARPRVYLLDEPSLGLSPAVAAILAESLRTLTAEGAAVVLAEQNAGFAQLLAGRRCMLRNGEIVED